MWGRRFSIGAFPSFYKVGMKMRSSLFLFLAVSLLLASCAPGVRALDSQSALETMVAATVRALPTLTPARSSTATITPISVRPTSTMVWDIETPSSTPGAMPSLTPFPSLTSPPATYRPVRITPGPRQGDYLYACRVLSYNPANYYNISPGQKFTVTWSVKNDGQLEWDLNSIDVAFRSGEKMTIAGDRFDIPGTVASGASMTVSITMTAPNKPGEYSNTWSLARGDSFFCKFSFRVHVVK
jgi:hypothetical protein